ncbi:hypothetical protein C3F00_005535 [Pseudomonas sp. MWU13-2860]|nr:hypothetical protein C3F00_005535 [Pseudomonas sp. MWU13-2860]
MSRRPRPRPKRRSSAISSWCRSSPSSGCDSVHRIVGGGAVGFTWGRLHGSPALTFNGQQVIVAQAIICSASATSAK